MAEHIDFQLRTDPHPIVRYSSGLTVYEEGLVNGRLVGRYWSAAGRIKPDLDIPPTLEATADLPVTAFHLEIDGQALDNHWDWVGVQEIPDQRGGKHLAVELKHRVRPVTVKAHTRLDGTPVMTRWLEITNLADRPAALSSVFPFAGLLWFIRDYRGLLPTGVKDPFTLGYFNNNVRTRAHYGPEGNFAWLSLPYGWYVHEGRTGRSGHGAPFFMLKNECNGEFFTGEVAWSTNWRLEFYCDHEPANPDAAICFRAGPAGTPPQRVIAAGESVVTPSVHLGHTHTDLDGAAQAMHAHVRTSVLPPQPPGRAQLVEANHWGLMKDKISEEALVRDIDVAADVGCELYILDAGWFGKEYGQWSLVIGDWDSAPWLPNGVEAIRDHVHRRGMLFGLWMEPECVGEFSSVKKAHPDWLLMRDGAPVVRKFPSGNRYALDLSKPEVAAWVESEVFRVIEKFKLDLFRLDYNIYVQEGGQRYNQGYIENTLWYHNDVLYRIFDQVREKYPQLILENCSSGGGRTDLGIVQRFHTTWTSDWATSPRGLSVLNSMTLRLPPEIVNRIYGAMNEDTYLYGDIDFQLRVAFMGHPVLMGISPSVAEQNPRSRERIIHHIQLYKSFIRPMLSTCKVYHHTPALDFWHPQDWCVLEYVSEDARRAVVAIFRLAPDTGPDYTFLPRGLDSSLRYKVTRDNKGRTAIVAGETLIDQGLRVRLESPLTSEFLLFEAE